MKINGRLFRTRVSSLLIVIAFVCMGFIGFCFETEEVSAAGPTYVSGIISSDTTWTEANSPYIVTGNTLVEQHVTLTINPGVIVKFDTVYIKIKGSLIAEGTKANIITFTSNKTNPAPKDWIGIKFENAKDSRFKYCNLEYSYSGIECKETSLDIYNCNLSKNNQSGIYLESSNSIISNNSFFDNDIFGIWLDDGTGINSNVQIKGNFIFNNRDGIVCYGGNIVNITNNIIKNNGVGIGSGRGSHKISNNIIVNNTFKGIYFGSSSSAQIEFNNISNNGLGLDIYSGTPLINFNNIFQNLNYSIENIYDQQVNAQNNWWGTTNPNLINQSIYDYYDDFEKGKVNYIPFLTSPVNISIQPPPKNKTNHPPVANAGPDQKAKVGETVYFDGNKSYDPDGDSITYKWDFDDGTSTSWSNNCNTSHSFTKEGTYNVTLKISDGLLNSKDYCYVVVSNESGGSVNGTEVSGVISKDTIWTLANSPYYLTNNVYVKPGVTLTIEPGVVVESQGYYYIKIEGGVIANGTENKKIIFKSNKFYLGSWKGIEISNATIVYFKYCEIKNSNRGIKSNYSNISIFNSKFELSLNDIEISYGKIQIYNNNFSGRDVGIKISQSQGEISNNYFKHPLVGIKCDGNICTPVISNNYIRGFLGEGISIINDASPSIINNTIKGENRGIIYSSKTKGQILNNTIFECSDGIIIENGATSIIKYNYIKSCSDGITTKDGALPIIKYNSIERCSGYGIIILKGAIPIIEYNNIINNAYNLVNENSKDIDVIFNWWGTTNTNEINRTIRDYFDDYNFGKVNYIPFLTSPVNISLEHLQNDGSNQTQPQNQTQPKIAESNIPNGSTNVSINNSQIKLYFSNPMNRTSVESALKISPNINYSLYWGNDDTELLIIFNLQLPYNTSFQVTIDTSAKDKNGHNLDERYNLEFTTEIGKDDSSEDGHKPVDNMTNILIITIVVLVIIIILTLAFILRVKKGSKPPDKDASTHELRHEPRQGKIAEEYYVDDELNGDSEKLINDLLDEALVNRKPSDFGTPKEKMLQETYKKYRKGEISKATYELIEGKLKR